MPKLTDRQRAEIVVLYKTEDWSYRSLATKYKCRPNVIAKWVKRADSQSATAALTDRPRCGAKRKTTTDQDNYLIEQYKTNFYPRRMGNSAIAAELSASTHEHAMDVSPRTICNRLREASATGKAKVVPKKFYVSPKHAEKRVEWCKTMGHEDFSKWLFSDERLFTCNPRTRKGYQVPGLVLQEPKFKHPTQQNVWACIGADGVGRMCFIDETLTGELYREILRKHLKRAASKLFPYGVW